VRTWSAHLLAAMISLGLFGFAAALLAPWMAAMTSGRPESHAAMLWRAASKARDKILSLCEIEAIPGSKSGISRDFGVGKVIADCSVEVQEKLARHWGISGHGGTVQAGDEWNAWPS
jgi:hypothetical protein